MILLQQRFLGKLELSHRQLGNSKVATPVRRKRGLSAASAGLARALHDSCGEFRAYGLRLSGVDSRNSDRGVVPKTLHSHWRLLCRILCHHQRRDNNPDTAQNAWHLAGKIAACRYSALHGATIHDHAVEVLGALNAVKSVTLKP